MIALADVLEDFARPCRRFPRTGAAVEVNIGMAAIQLSSNCIDPSPTVMKIEYRFSDEDQRANKRTGCPGNTESISTRSTDT